MPFFSGQQTDEEVESQLLWADPPLCRTTRKNHFHHQHHVSHDLILLQKKKRILSLQSQQLELYRALFMLNKT